MHRFKCSSDVNGRYQVRENVSEKVRAARVGIQSGHEEGPHFHCDRRQAEQGRRRWECTDRARTQGSSPPASLFCDAGGVAATGQRKRGEGVNKYRAQGLAGRTSDLVECALPQVES